PALDGIVVNIFDLLPHHGISHHLLGMKTLLPQLMHPITLGLMLKDLKMPEPAGGSPLLQQIDSFAGGVGFEASDLYCQIIALQDGMEVILHDHVGVKPDGSFITEKT